MRLTLYYSVGRDEGGSRGRSAHCEAEEEGRQREDEKRCRRMRGKGGREGTDCGALLARERVLGRRRHDRSNKGNR